MFNLEIINAKAKDLGFNFASITQVNQTPHFENYLYWLDKNQYGQMDFLHQKYVIESRRDPNRLFINAQSMIVLGVNYGPIAGDKNKHTTQYGKIASYAQYADYHKIIKSKAIELMDSLETVRSKKINFKIFIDSGPVMEKDFAFAAGLGWIGKNSLLIHPKFGSFTFLCCILTNESVAAPSIRYGDLCGDCQLCMLACPTTCISGDHTINASQCISYLTIEYKGIIPLELRSQIGERVFGCDVCQTICPYNLSAQISDSKLLFNSEILLDSELDLLEEMALSETTYSKKYSNTPINRASYEQYERNVIIAAGNSRDAIYVDALNNFLMGRSEILRAHAAWAIGEIAHKKCCQILRSQLQIEESDIVKKEILNALNNFT